jgi:hypothetical protein
MEGKRMVPTQKQTGKVLTKCRRRKWRTNWRKNVTPLSSSKQYSHLKINVLVHTAPKIRSMGCCEIGNK